MRPLEDKVEGLYIFTFFDRMFQTFITRVTDDTFDIISEVQSGTISEAIEEHKSTVCYYKKKK